MPWLLLAKPVIVAFALFAGVGGILYGKHVYDQAQKRQGQLELSLENAKIQLQAMQRDAAAKAQISAQLAARTREAEARAQRAGATLARWRRENKPEVIRALDCVLPDDAYRELCKTIRCSPSSVPVPQTGDGVVESG